LIAAGRQDGPMNFLRVVLGLAIAAIGFITALVMLMIAFVALSQDNHSLVERIGFTLIGALIVGVILVGTYYVFRKLIGRTPPDDGGG
jgi:hypothetical protein